MEGLVQRELQRVDFLFTDDRCVISVQVQVCAVTCCQARHPGWISLRCACSPAQNAVQHRGLLQSLQFPPICLLGNEAANGKLPVVTGDMSLRRATSSNPEALNHSDGLHGHRPQSSSVIY